MNDHALETIKRNMGERVEGKIFLNNRGEPWTKYALCNRMWRLSKTTGVKLAMYDARHGYATRKLKANHGHLEIAATMGHTDGSMIAKVYSHIDEDDEHLRKVLID
jgi:integrase